MPGDEYERAGRIGKSKTGAGSTGRFYMLR